MGTRCGDLDPAVVLHIQNTTGRGPKEMDKLFNKESGLLGLAGKSDIRAILEESAQGHNRASLAMNVSTFCAAPRQAFQHALAFPFAECLLPPWQLHHSVLQSFTHS